MIIVDWKTKWQLPVLKKRKWEKDEEIKERNDEVGNNSEKPKSLED